MHIYLDNASTTPMFPDVIRVMTEVMNENFGNPSSIHFHGRKSKSIIENARRVTANTINASLSEIFFTSSATEANNMVLKNVVQDHHIQRIITSPTEHHCILHSLDYLQKVNNIEVVVMNVDSEGNIDYDQLEELLKLQGKKTLVSIMHGNNEIGTMSDLHRIGVLCNENQALFHCDAVQTVGKYPIDVQSSMISYLSGSAHKFHGPKGAGFVFINNDFMLSPYIHGGAQERNMRAGTENVTAIAGLATALELISRKM
ncbi:MAG: cysteine desulfurase family protein, partial [Saprospiraceae bacterium]